MDPDLSELAGERPLPHVYHDPLRLCLTLPGTREWTGTMRIDQTFVPWATTWLYYFEEWLISDEWKGGGKHPDPTDTERYTAGAARLSATEDLTATGMSVSVWIEGDRPVRRRGLVDGGAQFGTDTKDECVAMLGANRERVERPSTKVSKRRGCPIFPLSSNAYDIELLVTQRAQRFLAMTRCCRE